MSKDSSRWPDARESAADLTARWAVGEQVRRLRTHAGLSQNDLAERLREQAGATILRDGINDLERGRRELRSDLLLGLSLALGVAPVEILAGPGTDDELIVLDRHMTARDYSGWVRGELPLADVPVRQAPPPSLHDRVEELERRLASLEDRLPGAGPS